MVKRCEDLIEADIVLFENRKIFPKFVLAPFRLLMDSKLDRLSLHKLECKMDSTGYPDDHNVFELGYCGHTQFSYSKMFLGQASDLIILQFQEEDHPFIIKALGDWNIHLVALYSVYKHNTDTPRTKKTDNDENTYKFGPKYGGEFTGFHRHMISVVVFSYSETLKSTLVEYTATDMGFLDDYYDADPNHKSIRVNGIATFLFHVAKYIIFCLTNCVKTILIANASLNSFYSRLGFTVIKHFATYTTFEASRSQFHYEKVKCKAEQKQTIELQCLYTIPRRVRFIHDYRINFNIHKNVFRYLDVISTPENWFPNKYIEDEIKKK